MNEDDPMAVIRSRYERFEGHPVNRLTNAVRAGGMRVTDSQSRGIKHEVAFDGMCVGFITEENGVNVLEISKKETTPEMIAAVTKSIEISKRNANTHAMRAQMGIAYG